MVEMVRGLEAWGSRGGCAGRLMLYLLCKLIGNNSFSLSMQTRSLRLEGAENYFRGEWRHGSNKDVNIPVLLMLAIMAQIPLIPHLFQKVSPSSNSLTHTPLLPPPSKPQTSSSRCLHSALSGICIAMNAETVAILISNFSQR